MNVKSCKICPILLVAVVFLKLCLGDETRDFLSQYDCKIIKSEKADNIGFSSYGMEIYQCNRNIFPSVFGNATCNDYCVNPITSIKLSSDFKSVPIYGCTTFEVRDGGTRLEKIPTAFGCRCIFDDSGTFDVATPQCN